MMTNQEKKQLVERVKAKQERLGGLSNNATAKLMQVSGATLSKIMNGKWESITDAWRKVANWVGGEQWVDVPTGNGKRIHAMCSHAQALGITKAVSFRQGSGKSHNAKTYANSTPNVYYLEVEPHYTKKVFLQKLSIVMGLSPVGGISQLVDEIVERLNSLDNPLIILDEFDQLKDNVLVLFKTFYNKANTGIMLIGGLNFKKRIEKGANNAKQSFCEIHSRLGGEFLPMYEVEHSEIRAICEANGVYSQKEIQTIIKECKRDLRTVRSKVEMLHLKRTTV